MVDSTWDEVLTGATHNVAGSSGRRLRQLASSIIMDGTVVSGGVNWVQLDADASGTAGSYDPSMIVVTQADGTVQCRNIFQYGTDKKAIVDRNWKVIPTNTSTYVLHADAGREHVNEGLVRAATLNTVQLNANASTQDNAYRGQLIFIRSGTGEDQVRRALSYNGTTQTATVMDWDITPDATSAYAILPTGAMSYSEIESAVWDATMAAHTASGSMGEAENKLDATISSRHASGAAVAAVTGNVAGSVGSVLGNLGGSVVGNVSGSVASVLGNVNGSVGSVSTGVPLSSASLQGILDLTISGTYTLQEVLQVLGAAIAGKVSGAGTSSITIRNLTDTADVIVAVTDASGNRSAVTLTPS